MRFPLRRRHSIFSWVTACIRREQMTVYPSNSPSHRKCSTSDSPSLSTTTSAKQKSQKRVPSGMRLDILHRAEQKRVGVSLMGMFRMGSTCPEKTKLLGAQFLFGEIPVRLARSLKQLYDLPYNMSQTPGVQKIINLYEEIYDSTCEFTEPTDEETARQYTMRVRKHLEGPALFTVIWMSESVMAVRETVMRLEESDRTYENQLLRQFVDDFLIGRIGVRMLANQQTGLYFGPEKFVGIIDPHCQPILAIESAAKDATEVCQRTFDGVAPTVKIIRAQENGTDESVWKNFTYVPSHIHIIVFELLKNSMRAVVEFHKGKPPDELPPIEIVCAIGKEDVTIKISDQGGGMPQDDLEQISYYTYSSAPLPTSDLANFPDLDQFRQGTALLGLFHAPMSGLGYGVPLSKLYARYFGGDVQIVSMDGHGTDAFIYLSRIEHEELLDLR
eukprot:506733_1